MFNFLEELCELAESKITEVKDSCKLIMIGGKILYVSNYKRILAFTDNLVVLKVISGELQIEGNSLVIKSLSDGEIIIKGSIDKIVRV